MTAYNYFLVFYFMASYIKGSVIKASFLFVSKLTSSEDETFIRVFDQSRVCCGFSFLHVHSTNENDFFLIL